MRDAHARLLPSGRGCYELLLLRGAAAACCRRGEAAIATSMSMGMSIAMAMGMSMSMSMSTGTGMPAYMARVWCGCCCGCWCGCYAAPAPRLRRASAPSDPPMRRRLAHGAAAAPTPLRSTRACAAASPSALRRHRRRSARPAHAPPPRPRRCGGTDAAPLDPPTRPQQRAWLRSSLRPCLTASAGVATARRSPSRPLRQAACRLAAPLAFASLVTPGPRHRALHRGIHCTAASAVMERPWRYDARPRAMMLDRATMR